MRAVADDEELARRVIREYLEKVPEMEIVAECANGLEAVKAVAEHKPDVIFLDVQMPKTGRLRSAGTHRPERGGCVRHCVRSVCNARSMPRRWTIC